MNNILMICAQSSCRELPKLLRSSLFWRARAMFLCHLPILAGICLLSLVGAGCGSPRGVTSELAGTWVMVRTEETVEKENEPPRIYTITDAPIPPVPVAVIRTDGTFDLSGTIFSAVGPGIAMLRKTGDQYPADAKPDDNVPYYEVELSKYTPRTSLFVVRSRDANGNSERFTLFAEHRSRREIIYREVFEKPGFKRTRESLVKRLRG